MARRDPAPAIALFPFLSVLMCAIGAMVAIFVCTSLLALESPSQAWYVPLPDSVCCATPMPDVFGMEPRYVHATGHRVTIYYSREEKAVINFSNPLELYQNHEVTKFLERSKKDRMRHWPVFMVRPSGMAAMTILYNRLKQDGVKVGKYAIGEHQSIDFE